MRPFDEDNVSDEMWPPDREAIRTLGLNGKMTFYLSHSYSQKDRDEQHGEFCR